MIPYSTQSITAAEIAAVSEVLTSGWLTQGPAVPLFEEQFASLHVAPHAVAVSSATAGLHLACLALGVGPASRVWTSPISYVASANCARYCGAAVDFVDVDQRSGLMSIDALRRKLETAQRESALPDVVIPVDYAGQPCDLAPMRELANAYGFRIVDDASHAVGALYRDAPIGSRYADLTVFSFHPVKIITSGEGGLVLAHDDQLADTLRLLRSHGVTRDSERMQRQNAPAWYYEQQALGYNYRMTDIQAALGRAQLERLPALARARQRLAERYDTVFATSSLEPLIRHADRRSALHLYPVRIPGGRRDTVFHTLREAGIGANVHYYPIHLQPYYRRLGFGEEQFPKAEAYASETLSLPLFPDLSDAQQDQVIEVLQAALR